MLEHKFFHRARKVLVSDVELKGKKKGKKSGTDDESKKKPEAKPKDGEKKEKEKITDAESSVVEGKAETGVSVKNYTN